MAIYIEVIILDNFIIDYIILSICGMKERRKSKWWRFSLASCLGVVIAFVSLADTSDFVMLILKIIASVLMVLIAFGRVGFWKMLFDFYFFTFAIGGGAMGVLYLKEGVDFGVLGKISSVPTGVIFGAVFGGYILAKRCIYIFNGRGVKSQYLYTVQFENHGEVYPALGFLDTGNLLSFGNDLRGVCVCEYRKMASVFKGQKPRGQVFLATATGGDFLNVYTVEVVKIYEECKWKNSRGKSERKLVLRAENVAVALSKTAIFDDFEVLLSPRLFY